MIEQVDFYIRLITIGASVMLVAQIVDGQVRLRLKLALLGLLVGVIGYLINSTPALEPSGWPDHIVNFLAMMTPFWCWLFARQLFEREAPVRIVQAVAVAMVATFVLGNTVPEIGPLSFYVARAISLVLIVDLTRVAFQDRDDDLIEERRVIRLVLPLLIAAQTAFILIFEIFIGPTFQFSWFQLINAVIILIISLFSGLALMRTESVLLLETQEDAPSNEKATELDFSPGEKVLHEKLTAAMAQGTYRAPGLTISALAQQLGTPEHRLRVLINRRLGHRNFSAFLNRYRITEAQQVLSDEEHVDVPILTVAMDLGYNSLPPFNRAFRKSVGTSPSKFRKQAFQEKFTDILENEADQK